MVNNKAYRGLALRTVVVTMLVLLLAGGAGAQTPIGACGPISLPGEYVLNADLSGVTTCISITSSDVIFDGAGHTITNNITGTSDGVYVHNFSTTLTNVTVKNLNVTGNWFSGIRYNNVANGNITNNTVNLDLNNTFGILLESSSYNMISYNYADSNGNGIYLQNGSNNNNLTGNSANSNNFNGISLINSENNNLISNTANSNNQDGISLVAFGSNNYLIGNNANSNNHDGISLYSFSNNNYLTGNNANSNNGNGGIYLAFSSNNTLNGNNASNNSYGIFIASGSNNNLSGNTANSNSVAGINLVWPNNILSGNNASNNSYGIYLTTSNNTLSGNTANSNSIYGIYLSSSTSSNNTLSGNTANSNNIAGIQLDSSNNILSGNNVSNNTNGIYLASSSSYNMLSGNNANLNANVGIYLTSSSYNTLINNNVLNNFYGIFLSSSSYNNLSGNNANSNSFDGIGLSSSSNNALSANYAISNNNNGIFLSSSSSNNMLVSNTAISNNNTGIYLYSSSSNNTLINNNVMSNFNAINLHISSDYNTLSGNNILNNSNGVTLISSSNNNLSNNIVSNSSAGIALSNSSNYNTLSGNNVYLNANVGIYLTFNSSNNTLHSNNVSLNNNISGILLYFSSNNSIYNNFFNNTNNFVIINSTNIWNITKTPGMSIVGGANLGGNVWAYPNGTGFSQNCTDGDNDGICDLPYTLDSNNTDYLPLAYKQGLSVQSSTGQGPVFFSTDAGTIVNLTAVNVSDIPEPPPAGANLFYGLFRFNITGLTPGGSANLTLTFPAPLPLNTTYLKFGANATNTTPHWYNIYAVINGSMLKITLTDGGVGDDDLAVNGTIRDDSGPSIPVSNIITSCTTISSPGEYVLNQSIMNSGASSCINITSSDVIFDGAGYTIDGIDGANTNGVYAYNLSTALTNITVKNLNATDWQYGIHYNNVTNGSITNNTVSSNTYSGISLDYSSSSMLSVNNASNNPNGIILFNSSGNMLSSNNARNNTNGINLLLSSNNTVNGSIVNSNTFGISLDYSDNSKLSGNTATNNYYGINLGYSNNNILSSNTANSNNGIGIALAVSSNNTLSANNVSNNGVGIALSTSSNNTLSSNNASNNNQGIYLTSSSNNTLIGNNASNNLIGIRLEFSSNNNTLGGNTANSNNGQGISLYVSSNNTLIGNNVLNTTVGISLSTSSNNNILSGNNASNNGNGITLASSSNNTIYNNYFNNTDNAIDGGGGVNNWNITKQPGTNIIGGPYLGGNFWSNYTGVDINGDGLGDTLIPYNNSGNIIFGGDYLPLTQVQVLNVSAIPSITSWGNNKTNNQSLNLTINTSEFIRFNVTANQTIITWNWFKDGVNQNNNYDNFTTSFIAGSHIVTVNATNINGTSNAITWTINTVTSVMYGVNLTNISALTNTTIPGTNATYTLRLTNNGTAADSYTLTIDNPDGASTAALNISSPVFLNAGQSRIFALNVTNTSVGVFRVNVTARSTNDTTRFAYVNTTTTVTGVTYGVNLINISNLSLTTVLGINAAYTLRLTNNGTAADSYNLTIDNPNNASTAALNITSPVFLNAGASKIFTLNVTNTSAGVFRVNVTARSNNDTTRFAYVNTTTTVTGVTYGVNLTNISSLNQTTVLGTNATYSLRLTNNGTAADSYTLTIDNPDSASIAALNISSPVFLNAGASRIFMLNVTNTSVGVFRVNVTARSNNDTTRFAYVNTTTTVIVLAPYGVNLTSISALTNTTIPGTNATYTLRLTNNGTAADSYTLTIDNPDSASTAALNISSPVFLNAGASRIFMLNVTNTTAGVFRVNVTARSNNDTTRFAYVNTTTNVTAAAISVNSSTGKGTVYFEIDAGTIENLTALNVSDIPEPPPAGADLFYGLFRFNITGLPYGGSANLTLTFPAPLPLNTTYLKFGANATNTTPHWYNISAVINGSMLTITLTDGGVGDDDLAVNGAIRDDSGPSFLTGEIHGMKWNDSNGNGIRDLGELGVMNVTICASGPSFNCTQTNATGNYSLMNLSSGNYTVYEILPPGRVQTYPNFSHFINLSSGAIVENINFGNMLIAPGVIRGMKWNDSNGNGIKDMGELGVMNVTICASGPSFNCTQTNATGNYSLLNLTAGFYSVYEILPPGRVQTFPANFSYFINLSSGAVIEGVNFGNMNASEIHGMKFNDSNGNGIKDFNESGVSFVSIQLTRIISPGNETFAGFNFTDVNGNYSFMNLLPGFYRVEELPTGRSQTFPANGSPHFINLSAGEVRVGVDFGNQPVPPGEIRGMKFNDSNGNGVQDPGESGVSGVSICISPIWSCTTTDFTGNYSFPNVTVGTHTVYEGFISGRVATTPGFVTVTVNSSQVVVVNFGNRLLVPPSDDVSIQQQFGEQNGVPMVFRPGLTILTIRKNLTNISSNVTAVNLTLKWSDGTTKTTNMTQIDATNVWDANFSSPFPPGTAQMTFKVDVAPAGPGVEDAVQIGDIIFIDPSGQIQDACNGAPISNATVTLFVEFPPNTGNFIVSPPANQMPPDNPLTTGADGMYSWLTVPGTYKVRAEKIGFITNKSPSVSVPPPVFNLNISLTPTGGCPTPTPTGNVTGGGWIVSPITPAPKNNNRATFGFVAHFANGATIPSGNIEYTDHVSNMKVKGNVTTLSVNKTTMNATFGGTATINGAGAYSYTVKVHDGGEPGRMDTFAINITAISYTANGTLGGGNIQIHN